MKNSYSDIVANAKQYAREAIRETWPTAREVAEPTIGMYEFDSICIDEETCPISSVSIMHDPDAGTFALVENVRPIKPPKEKATQVPTFHFAGPIDWDKLSEDHAIAYLRGDLAASSPESYTIEEMKAISDGMFESTAKVEAAFMADFAALSPIAQDKMLDLLKQTDSNNYKWWLNLLLGDMPNGPSEISIAK